MVMAGETSYFPGNTKKHRTQLKNADLRFAPSVNRNSVVLHDARNTGAAGFRTDGNHSDLYIGRSNAGGAGTCGIGNPWDRDEAGGEWGDFGARAEYFSRLLAAA